MTQNDPSREDKATPDTPAGTQKGSPHEHPPAAGPHAEPELTNPDATPGSGALPPVDGAEDEDMGSTG